MTKIRWHPPLERLFGPVTELEVAAALPVARLLGLLVEKQPEFERYGRFDPEGTRPDALLVWRREEPLTLSDLVEPGDELEVFVWVTGG